MTGSDVSKGAESLPGAIAYHKEFISAITKTIVNATEGSLNSRELYDVNQGFRRKLAGTQRHSQPDLDP